MSQSEKALKSDRVKTLYDEVNNVTPVSFVETQDEYWRSSTSQGKTVIHTGKAKIAAAAMYHELLHARLKNTGYTQYLTALITNDYATSLKGTLEALDNELQHHKMYADFISAGFASERFYSDTDKHTYRDITNAISTESGSYNLIDYFLKFLSVIAPGGQGKVNKRKELKELILSKCGGENKAILEKIEIDIRNWASSSSNDHSQILRSIITDLKYDRVWIGKDQNFPHSGFFVGEEFEPQSAEIFMKSRGFM